MSKVGVPLGQEGVEERPQRKVRLGIVTSDRMDKTVVVQITQTIRHPLYPKIYRRRKNLYAHDETNAIKVGDTVRIMETRPLSKLKRWRVVEVLERAK
ncbi:MAG: small subunit ribosomal protein [Actinomycetota bacterium]|nr:small subunit ribosomal protein [Actinomycetota bacterium]MEA2590211.1 small subunit ribosomal protein [Actinomycetota bacterium]